MAEKVDRVIYQFWTGDVPMSPNRINAQKTSEQNLRVPCQLLLKDDIRARILKEFPLHPAYPYLSDTHKSDYLRSYFMYHFGGGYADIKYFSPDNNWSEMFDLINSDERLECIGEQEIPGWCCLKQWRNPEDSKKMLVNCWFICRPHANFARVWYDRVQKELDVYLDALRRRPERPDADQRVQDGVLRWEQIHGEILHRLEYELYGTGVISNRLRSGRMKQGYR